MKNFELKLITAIFVVVFTALNAEIADNVSRYQLNAAYKCYVELTEEEFAKRCRNERDGFGHLLILPAS